MIGIDIITIHRFYKIAKNDYAHWSKFFTVAEWEYCFGKASPAQSLAGIYAAKEAVMKAVGEDLMERVDRIEIVHEAHGKPAVKIDNNDQFHCHISISHAQDAAVAVAISYEQ